MSVDVKLCTALAPGSWSRLCERAPHPADQEHRAVLSDRSYCYWFGDDFPVKCLPYHSGWREGAPYPDTLDASEAVPS